MASTKPTPALLAYNKSPVPALPSSLNLWLQNEDTKIEVAINSLIVAIKDLQMRVAALEAKGSS